MLKNLLIDHSILLFIYLGKGVDDDGDNDVKQKKLDENDVADKEGSGFLMSAVRAIAKGTATLCDRSIESKQQ